MNPTKTIMLRFKPIAEITEDEKENEVLATNGECWLKGIISDAYFGLRCVDVCGDVIYQLTHYAVLPKEE